MNRFLRFSSHRASNFYNEELTIQKFSDKPFFVFIIIFSTLYYLIDIILSTFTLDTIQEIDPTEITICLVLQIFKLIIFLFDYKFKYKQGKWSKFYETVFGVIFTASVISVWNIQLQTHPARTLIVGLDGAWTLLYLNKVLTFWELKIILSIMLIIFGLIKTTLVNENIAFVYLQAGLQCLFISIVIYVHEKNQRSEFVRKFRLERREQTLTTILNNIPYNIAILDLQGRLRHYNQYLDQCFNISGNQTLLNLFLKFYDVKPREKFSDQTLGEKTSSSSKKLPKAQLIRTSLRNLNNSSRKNAESSVQGPVFTYRKKRSSTILKPSRLEAYYSKTIGSNSHNSLAKDISLTEIFGNVEQYGTLQEVIDLFCENTEALRSCINKENNFFVFDGKYKDNMDKIRSFEIKISIATFDSDECLTLILRDTTHRDTIVALEGNSSFKDSILSSISHELKTPLNTNLNLLQMAIKDTAVPIELKDSFLLPAHQSGKLLESLINDILDYSLLLANKFVINIQGKHLFRNLEKLRYLSEFQAKKKNIEFHISISQKLTYRIWTDHRRLRQILINLLNNAIKFTSKGHISVRIEQFEDNENLIKFCVLDTGIGIPSQDLERMTDLLKKNVINEKLTSKSAEMGMGLIISSQLAKKLGPADEKLSGINVSSTPGEGSKFWFVIENKDKQFASPISLFSKNNLISQIDSPDSKLQNNEISNTGKTLFPYINTQLNTQEEIKASSLRRISSSRILKTQLDHAESITPPFTEIFDKSGLIDDELAEEKLACMIKDDNLKMNQNLTKMIKKEGLKKGLSKTSTFSRYPTSLAGSQTPNRGQFKNTSPKSADLPQIMLNMNPLISEDIGLVEEDSACACPEILVVDDDMFNLFTMQTLIKSLNLQMSQATNGKEAIDAVIKRVKNRCSFMCRNFKIIFMDLSMPTMDGFEATIKLREMMKAQTIPEVPIVACTAFIDETKLARCFEIGMSGKLLKPVAKSKLIETLKKFHIDILLE